MRSRFLAALSTLAGMVFMLGGCCSYHTTKPGKMEGTIYLAWIGPDSFIYIKSAADPLQFTRPGRTVPIVPEDMYTDGGSIPRLLWAHPEYSPWRFAPAYMVHDWLFARHHCLPPGQSDEYDVYSAADVMMEAIKRTMEDHPEMQSATTFEFLRAGVRSDVAKSLWETGQCRPLDADAQRIVDQLRPRLDAQRQQLFSLRATGPAATRRASAKAGTPNGTAIPITIGEYRTFMKQSGADDRLAPAPPDTQNILIPVTIISPRD